MRQTEVTQLLIGLAADGTGFFCTGTNSRTGSQSEELVEIKQKCDLQATDEEVSAPGIPSTRPSCCADGPWCQIGYELGKYDQASAVAAVSYLFAARR